MNDILQFVGLITCIGSAVAIVAFIWTGIKEGIRKFRCWYIRKHRFSKPPLAKCYCIDCKAHSHNLSCSGHPGWSTPDNGFCYDADPKKE